VVKFKETESKIVDVMVLRKGEWEVSVLFQINVIVCMRFRGVGV
jgi:hypothetical protein